MSRKQTRLNQEEAKVKYFKAQDIQISLTKIQKPIINSFIENEYSIVTGDPGTGKTTLALYYAIKQLLSGEFEKILISKNPVESGQSIGFLPGELDEKLAPYKESYIEVIVKLVGKLKATELLKSNKIEFVPFGFIRGKNFENAIIILDESQNFQLFDLISFITRKSETSKMILLGDYYQADIKNSGLNDLINYIFKNVKGSIHIHLGDEFQMRSKIIVQLYNNYKNFLNSRKK